MIQIHTRGNAEPPTRDSVQNKFLISTPVICRDTLARYSAPTHTYLSQHNTCYAISDMLRILQLQPGCGAVRPPYGRGAIRPGSPFDSPLLITAPNMQCGSSTSSPSQEEGARLSSAFAANSQERFYLFQSKEFFVYLTLGRVPRFVPSRMAQPKPFYDHVFSRRVYPLSHQHPILHDPTIRHYTTNTCSCPLLTPVIQ